MPYSPVTPIANYAGREQPKSCPPITPVNAVPLRAGLSLHVQHLVKALWKGAEPAANVTRGAIRIGNARQADQRPRLAAIRDRAANTAFRPQVAPTGADSFNEGEMALDWKEMDQIQRVSAFTFRGDRDGPNALLNARQGFKPPTTRTDRSYLEGAIYEHFASYLKRRYKRELTKQDFLAAVDQTVTGSKAQETLV